MRPSTRCRGRCTPRTRSTGSWRALGVGDEFAAHRASALGLRLLDRHAGAGEFRAAQAQRQRLPADEHVRPARARSDAARQPEAVPRRTVRGNVEVTSVTQNQTGRVRVSFLDRVRGGEQSVEASYVLGCDGANSMVRAASVRTCTGCRSSRTGWSSTSTPTPNSTSGRAATSCAARACRHLHARRGDPLSLGIPAA